MSDHASLMMSLLIMLKIRDLPRLQGLPAGAGKIDFAFDSLAA